MAQIPADSRACAQAPTTEENRAALLMPWTVIEPATANLLARRLRNHYRYYFSGTHMVSGSYVADDAIRDTPLSDVACFRTIHIFADGQHDNGHRSDDEEMGDTRDDVIASSYVDRIDGFAVPFIDPLFPLPDELQRYINQEYLHGIVSGTPDPDVGVVATDGALPVIHIAVETEDASPETGSPGFGDPNLQDLVHRAVIHAAYCPGDFNLDASRTPSPQATPPRTAMRTAPSTSLLSASLRGRLPVEITSGAWKLRPGAPTGRRGRRGS